jgi:glycosyltransferase involved in cell wall biosynthesis
VYNGCETPSVGLEPDPAVAALARAGGPVVGAIAAMRPQKRLDVLIEAAPLILGQVPEASVAIVGEGPLHTELESQVSRLGLDGEARLALLPFAPPAHRALAALDVYVLPSAWEAFPIGVLEAMACGVPQVATDVGGVGEAVTSRTGRLVAPGDPVALAQAVVGLLADRARLEACARASRERHAQLFTLDRMVAQTAAVYDAVA